MQNWYKQYFLEIKTISIPPIQEGQLSFSGERMFKTLANRLEN